MNTPLLSLLVVLVACVFSIGCGPRSSSPGVDGPAAGVEPWVVEATHDFGQDYESNAVTALAIQGDVLWAGTRNNLYECRYDPAARTFTSAGHGHRLAAEGGKVEVTRLLAAEGVLWVASSNGYARLDAGSWSKEDVGRINDICRFGKALFCATNNGVEILPDSSQEWKTVEIGSATQNSQTRAILSLCAQGSSTLWLGSKFGVHCFRPENRAEPWKRYFGAYQSPSFGGVITNEEGNCELAGNEVGRIALTSDGRGVLFSTLGGLSLLGADERWTSYVGAHFEAKSGEKEIVQVEVRGNTDLPSNEIQCALYDGKELWVATAKGLVLLAGEGRRVLFDVSTGLPSAAVKDLVASPDGTRLFVGTAYGLAVLRRQPGSKP